MPGGSKQNRTVLIVAGAVALALVAGVAGFLLRHKPADELPTPGTPDYTNAISAFYVGSIALESGKDDIAQTELTKVTQIVPKEAAAWANLGLFAIRHQQLEQAAKYLKQASDLAPNNVQIEGYYALLALSGQGNFADAITHLKKVVELDPQNLRARYALADVIERQAAPNSDADYQQQIEEILKLQPQNVQALIQLARIAGKQNNASVVQSALDRLALRSSDWSPDARAELKDLQTQAKTNARGVARVVPRLGNLLKTTLSWQQSNRALVSPPEKVGDPMLRLLTLPNPSPAPAAPDSGLTYAPQTAGGKAQWAAPIALDSESPSVVFQCDGAKLTGGKGVSLAWPGKGSTPLSHHSVCAFDWNYDFKTDLACAGAGGLKLYQQGANGAFTDVTAKTKLPASVLSGSHYGAWAADVEADGDLDLVVAPQTGPVQVLRNNGDGTWTAIDTFKQVKNLRAFAWADVDGDGDGDAALVDDAGKLTVFSNDRSGLFHVRPVPDALGKVVALAVADVNGDGVLDFVALKADGSLVGLCDKNAGAAWDVKPLGQWTNPPANLAPATATLFAADLDNNGSVDFVASAPEGTCVWLTDAHGNAAPLSGRIDAHVMGVDDLNGDGVCDFVGVNAAGQAVTLLASSPKKYHWQNVRPTADKSGKGDSRINAFGVGGEIELRAGLLFQKQPIEGPRVHFGLGENAAAQVARIVWPNGSSQAEFPDANTNGLKADQTVVMNQRLISSCPWLFAWNGSAMQLVTDCIWRSPLGLKINAQATAGVAQTSDWVHIRGDQLTARDGVYDLRITAELWETHFFDYLDLMTVDHPIGTEIYVDERFAIPPPPLALHATTPTRPFASAHDDTGADVSDIVNTRDARYLDTFGRGQYQGVTRDHWVEVELPADAPTDKPLNLIATGWIHPTDSSINVAISQGSHEPPKGLSLEVPDGHGGWQTAKPGLGFPEGKIKTIVLDLNGVFKPGVPRKLRLRTNLEIFWDYLSWAVVLPDAQQQQIRRTHAPMQAADLLYRGFSTTTQADKSSPELPDYAHVAGTAPNWRDLVGYYTRWGDVRPLLGKLDDRYVIMNAGDELRLRFAEQPAPPKGWTRDYILIGDGWVKDGNLNTTWGKTVCPLPTHRMADYTVAPTRLQDDPVYRAHKSDWDTYHTRYVQPERFHSLLKPTLPVETQPEIARVARQQ